MYRSPIYKTPFGFHIDLDAIIAVHPARFVDRMGSGGYFVQFAIDLRLRDKPLVWITEFEHGSDYVHKDTSYVVDTSGNLRRPHEVPEEEIRAVKRVQDQLNVLIVAWEEWKQHVHADRR